MSSPVRMQIISESSFVDAIKGANRPEIDITDHQLPDSDQNFGLTEVVAVIAIAKSIAELIKAVVDAYNATNNDNLEVTIKTADRTVTVKGKQARNVEDLMRLFES